jgi:hypothetical protein
MTKARVNADNASADIQGVTAGTGLTGGGTSGTVTLTNGMATAIDAKGDLVAGTGADTFDKLTVGANNTVLTADSSTATGLKWAAASAPSFVGVSVYRANPDQAIATATWTNINWTAENFDTDGFHDNTTNNTRLTIPTGKGGYYHVTSQIGLQGHNGTDWSMRIQKNGANLRYNVNTGQTYDASLGLDFTTNLAAGDYLELSTYQNSGTSKNFFQGTLYCWFELTYLGA